MRFLLVPWGLFKRDLIHMKRYLFDSISGIITIYFIFLLVFLGIKGMMGSSASLGNTVEAFTIGYILWILTLDAYSRLSYSLYNEALVGTLEQLYMSPFGFGWISSSIIIVAMITNVLTMSILIFFIIITTGSSFHFNVFPLIPVIIVTLQGVNGVGFIMGGLSLIFKKINSIFQIIQFAFIGLIAFPIDKVPLMKYLPLSMGYSIIRKIMTGNKALIAPGDYLFLILNSMFYLFIGYSIYKVLERKAKRDGRLGQY